MPEELAVVAGAVTVAGVVANKLFGSTLDTMGSDINEAYKKGRDKLLNRATAKVPNPNDGKIPNLRVARDVLWNGAITDNEVCAEYFGGILAASRSDDGSDDSALHYLDVIKSLSAKQLHLHYCIFSSMQKQLLQKGKKLNVGASADVRSIEVFMATAELERMGMQPADDLAVLHRVGVLIEYKVDAAPIEGNSYVPYMSARPTTFGVMVYAIAFNRFEDWRSFASSEFGTFSNVPRPQFYADSLVQLVESAGEKLSPPPANPS